MKQRWRKLGLLYCPPASGRHPALLTHAANPLPVPLGGDLYRVYYSGRDAANRSSVGAVDVDIVEGCVVQDHAEPFFEHGDPGSFFADGVSIGNCYQADGAAYMLFMGWKTPANAHWRGEIGRLRVHADGRLTLAGDAPFMGLSSVDPISLSYPWVLRGDDGSYRMWYGSTMTWDAGNREMLHVLHGATSRDGHRWTREGLAVPYEIGRAQAFSRPTVVREASRGYSMWFSCRSGCGETYRIGYASSPDAVSWQLALDSAGIDVSPRGWDSEMIAYPFVQEHAGRRYMFYNGNGYGKSGFGLAVWSP